MTCARQCSPRVDTSRYFSQIHEAAISLSMAYLLYQTTRFRLSKLKKFADYNFTFDENGRKLFKRVENTVGKGEIARYEQFLLFSQCFQKACFPGASKGVIVWEWVNILPYCNILSKP